MNYVLNVRNAWVDWTSSFDWNVCGALTFAGHHKPNLAEAQRHWSTFWAKVDRLCYGQSRGNQFHVPRFVYVHQGRAGDNPHIHFLAYTQCDPREFCVLLNAVWASMKYAGTAVPHQNEILPLISKDGASRYLQHEDIGYDMRGFDASLTKLHQINAQLRDDALDRLASEATSENVQAATAAFEQHVERAELRQIRRKAIR